MYILSKKKNPNFHSPNVYATLQVNFSLAANQLLKKILHKLSKIKNFSGKTFLLTIG